jgi:hypothetical protein
VAFSNEKPRSQSAVDKIHLSTLLSLMGAASNKFNTTQQNKEPAAQLCLTRQRPASGQAFTFKVISDKRL